MVHTYLIKLVCVVAPAILVPQYTRKPPSFEEKYSGIAAPQYPSVTSVDPPLYQHRVQYVPPPSQPPVVNGDRLTPPPPLPPRRKQVGMKPLHPLPVSSMDYGLSTSQHASPIAIHKPLPGGPSYNPPPPYGHIKQPVLTFDQQMQYHLQHSQYNSDSPLSSHSPSPAPSIQGQPISNVFNVHASSVTHVDQSPRPAVMHKWQLSPALVMGKVESKEVHFPEPQTATAPSMLTGAGYKNHPHHSVGNHTVYNPPHQNAQQFAPHQQHHIYHPQVNPSPATSMHGTQYLPQPTQHNIPSQHHIVAAIPSAGQNVQLAYQPSAVNTTMHHQQQMQGNTSRAQSMYHQADVIGPYCMRPDVSHRLIANQSPVSVHSTTSTRSTNSDIPDKPPPPYPGPHNPPAFQHQPPHLPTSSPHYQQQQTYHNVPNNVQSYLSNQHHIPDNVLYQEEEQELVAVAQSAQPNIQSHEKNYRTSPRPDRDPEAQKKEEEGHSCSRLKSFSSQAYKFFIEQHIENVFKTYEERKFRMQQLHTESAKANLPDETHKNMIQLLYKKESNYLRLKRANMNRSMFEDIKALGVGAFGSVTLVKKVNTYQLYAMKTLNKQDVLKRNQIAHVKAERDILAEADNEWVVKLYYSFQDREHLYFVMEYIPGGDMMGRLQKEGIFSVALARFYIAELVLAVESVHSMGFIHRDIKPDNILIDKDGHIKLTDFGLCTGFRWTHNSKLYQKGKCCIT